MTPESDNSTSRTGPSRRRSLATAVGIVALGLLSVVVLVATRPQPARARLDRPGLLGESSSGLADRGRTSRVRDRGAESKRSSPDA